MEILSRLIANFPERDTDEATKVERIRGYVIAVDGVPVDVLREASMRVLRGWVKDMDPRFMPTPPQLARLCAEILDDWNATACPAAPLALDRFDAPPDPKVVAKLASVQTALAKEVDSVRHENRAQWLRRMGDRVKLLA